MLPSGRPSVTLSPVSTLYVLGAGERSGWVSESGRYFGPDFDVDASHRPIVPSSLRDPSSSLRTDLVLLTQTLDPTVLPGGGDSHNENFD